MIRFLRFHTILGSRLLELSHVVEVLPMCALDRADGEGADRYCGLLQYRGRTLPVFDLSVARPERADQFLIVLRHPEGELALVADRVEDICEHGPDQISVIHNGKGQERVVQSMGELLRVVEPEQLL